MLKEAEASPYTQPVTSAEKLSESVPIIQVDHLTKKFEDFTAVNDISFEVREGEIFGFLGPNGAGKSTTIKTLCTLLQPTSGHIRVAGYDVEEAPDVVRSMIGIVFQDNSLDSDLTAQENMEFHCMVYHIPRAERKERIKRLLDLMELTEFKDRRVKTFSGGMRRRLEIARGLLHEPRLMVLDEPTVGLDPQTRNYIWQYVRDLRKIHHTAIFMTTHYMDEAENCDRIAIIDKGQIVALDTPAALKKMVGEDQIELNTRDNVRVIQAVSEHFQVPVSERDGMVVIQVPSAESFAPKLLAELPTLTGGVTIENLHIRRPSLEDVFLKLTGRTIREEEGAKDQRKLNLRRMGRIK
ncbi:MAG: ATP-binding cassette domain-containing protein [Anaerolineaceae bacterium]|nr:ATP-binding cassette domain-containing protein [Anaerolineaceae bacterium]